MLDDWAQGFLFGLIAAGIFWLFSRHFRRQG